MIKQLLRWNNEGTALLIAMCFAADAVVKEQATRQDSIGYARELSEEAERPFEDGQYAAAIALTEHETAISNKLLGPEHPDTVRSLNTLGQIHLIAGSYAKAELVYLRALAICEVALDSHHFEALI